MKNYLLEECHGISRDPTHWAPSHDGVLLTLCRLGYAKRPLAGSNLDAHRIGVRPEVRMLLSFQRPPRLFGEGTPPNETRPGHPLGTGSRPPSIALGAGTKAAQSAMAPHQISAAGRASDRRRGRAAGAPACPVGQRPHRAALRWQPHRAALPPQPRGRATGAGPRPTTPPAPARSAPGAGHRNRSAPPAAMCPGSDRHR